MRTHKTDGQIAVLGEVRLALAFEHTLHHSRDACANLSVVQFLGQLLLPGKHCQRLQDSQTIRNGTSDNGESTFGRDETLEDNAVLLHTFCHHFQTILGAVALVAFRTDEVAVVTLAGCHHLKTLAVHRLDDVGVVVVKGKRGTVRIEAVADVPFLSFAHRHLNAEGVVAAVHVHQERLFHTHKQQPVGIRGVIATQALQFLDIARLSQRIQRLPEGFVSTEQALHDVSCIHQRLAATCPSEVVRALGIYGILVGLQRPFAQLLALLSLGGVVVRQSQPGSDTSHQATEAFHVGHFLVAVVPSGRELQLHVLLECAVGHVFQHGRCHRVGQFHPVGTVTLTVAQGILCRLHLLLAGSHSYARREEEHRYNKE